MAIKASIVTIQGLSLTNTYINFAPSPQIIKVKTETGNVYRFGGNACVYSNKEYYDATLNPIPIEGFSVVCDLDLSQNLYEQGYAELKTNPRLSEIVDLLA